MNRIRPTALSAALSALALSVALAGCGNEESVVAQNESAESVADKVAASGIKPRPGRWESTMQIENMDIPNLPPEAKEMFDKQMSAVQSFTTCLTPEQAEKPDAGFFRQDASGCTYENFTMAGGKIDARMICKQGQQNQTMTMAGTYGEESYDIKVSTEGEAQPGMPMSMTMSIASKRVGECNGNEEQ